VGYSLAGCHSGHITAASTTMMAMASVQSRHVRAGIPNSSAGRSLSSVGCMPLIVADGEELPNCSSPLSARWARLAGNMEGGTMFRFSIRELLILTVTVGLAVGWWIDHRKLGTYQLAADEWRRCAGGLESILSNDGWHVYRGYGHIRAKKYNNYTKTGFTIRTLPDNLTEPKLDSEEARPAEIDARFFAPHLSGLRR
jgi:hypothetical protein